MQGQKLSERTYELIKQMLIQGYSAKKIKQMLPEEIAVCQNTIYKIEKSKTYDDYCGVKREEKPQMKMYVTHEQNKEVVDAINRNTIVLESVFQVLKELVESLT